MGNCINWQKKIENEFKNLDLVIFNPRRDDWNPNWKQEKDNPQFRKQVEWELIAQEESDLIIMYLDPKTKSLISLLELGLFKDKKIIVCCPKGFYRKGNIDFVCERYVIIVCEDLDNLINMMKSELPITIKKLKK